MAEKSTRELHAEWRSKIQSSLLINRLNDFAKGEIEMSRDQIKAVEILLKKTMPDLKQIDTNISGANGDPLEVHVIKRIVVDPKNDVIS